MGVACTHPTAEDSKAQSSQTDFYHSLCQGHRGQLLHVCSYDKWTQVRRTVCGFTDSVDYITPRDTYQRFGIMVKPDTLEGRCFAILWKSSCDVILKEKVAPLTHTLKIPRVLVASDQDLMMHRHAWFYGRRHRHRESNVVAARGDMAVMQVNCDRHVVTGKFYILDLSKGSCLGYFLVMYHARRWYEVYISPARSRILLRPDHVPRIVMHPDLYVVQNLTLFKGSGITSVSVIPGFLRTHVLAFNPLLGEDGVILGQGQDIEIRLCQGEWPLKEQFTRLNLPADIQQIRCSSTGSFLAVRCVHPVHSIDSEYLTNFVVILSYPQVSVLLQLDTKGYNGPASDVINLQVFPRFSPSEACIAVMRNYYYKRKVYVYKLPLRMQSLQELCRRALLHLVGVQDLAHLNLPHKLRDFVQQRREPSITPARPSTNLSQYVCHN